MSVIGDIVFGKKKIISLIKEIVKYKSYRKIYFSYKDFITLKQSVDSTDSVKQKEFTQQTIIYRIR